MKWIPIKYRKPDPNKEDIIVAIMEGRIEMDEDPIEDALIVILRNLGAGWRSMDSTEIYYMPDENDEDYHWDCTVKYWVPWQEFGFPESMIVKDNNELD